MHRHTLNAAAEKYLSFFFSLCSRRLSLLCCVEKLNVIFIHVIPHSNEQGDSFKTTPRLREPITRQVSPTVSGTNMCMM